MTGEYAKTLDFLHTLGLEVTGAELGRLMAIKPTAANNRLARLEQLGLLSSRRYGRKRIYRAKE